MNKQLKKILKKSRQINLTRQEKEAGKAVLAAHMRANPVRENTSGRLWILQRLFINQYLAKTMPIAVLLIIALSGGASLAAQGTEPGDALYPVKVSVNEQVRGWFTFSDEAKAELMTDLALSRLEEAEILATEGKLDSKTQAKLEQRFAQKIEAARSAMARLTANGKVDAATAITANFEAELAAHEQVLAHLGQNQGNHSLAARVSNQIAGTAALPSEVAMDDASTMMVEQESTTSGVSPAGHVISAAEGKIKAAGNKIEEVEKLLDRKNEKLSAELKFSVENRLKVAKELHTEARAQFAADVYGEAFTLAQEAHRVAQEAKIILVIQNETKIDINLPEAGRLPDMPTVDGRRVQPSPPDADTGSGVSGQVQGAVNAQINL
ncbi:MAG: hypothetical protein COU11_00860 [Candidatus Harrisonbacteria bacterium CG10_big_fil_rev_8_21_14_0_10_49_15]|uniref:DUF5667 domain-containing protein n=1 Tax=Candidatus Harrisonbacteria bacterium CG10_big_fil_rev_8_21_14_0_10_49_15 TaxID=1974587 RepID=A0A2H0ULU6_9BACT|nr:MAG: hypothetical protein COU11_00860 [Candidatus Harrisonbacteria bacterium CG10_big_fil_rev_8_21_14_0_10_49_15]